MKELPIVMNEIIDNNLSHYYIFTGEETGVLNIYINKIISAGYLRVDYDTVSEAVQDNFKVSFTNQPKCYIITDDIKYLQDEKNWESVHQKFEKSNNILILKYTKLDKRSKFYKNEPITQFDKLNDDILSNHIPEGLNDLNYNERLKLIHICENNYNQILLESDKVEKYKKVNKLSSSQALDELIKLNVIHKPIGDITFDFVNAVAYGDLNRSYELLDKIKRTDESTLGILALLYNNFKNMLLVQGLGKDKSNAENRTGLKYGVIQATLHNIGAYKISELRNALDIITSVEQGIKNGSIDDSIALDYTIIKIMS